MNVQNVTRKFKRLVIKAKTPIAKPCNGSVNNSKINSLLVVSNGGENGEKGKRYLVKGLRGVLNNSMMALAKQRGIEVCHSSNKVETQSGESLLPTAFHPNGACFPEDECIRHRLMGSIKKQSILRFEPVIIVSENVKEEVEDAEKMHVATENRVALVEGSKKSIQDFGERYVAGKFTIKIELRKELTKEELGFLLKSILFMSEIGFGGAVNNGAGKLVLKEIVLQEVERSRTIRKGKVIEEEKVRNLWKQMEEALEAW